VTYVETSNSGGAATLDHQKLAEHVRASYRNAAAQYRKDDEIEISTDLHSHLSAILGSLSGSFARPITVLDVGCGTGRYFHCLKNVKRLVGIDVSQEMLGIARNPVLQEKITIEEIELRCENAHLAKFPTESFDMIYSLGMFGSGCPVTAEICNRFYDWLAPGGHLFFNAVSVATMPFARRVRRRIRNALYPVLPKPMKNALEARSAGVPFFGLSERELARIVRTTRFEKFTISSHLCNSQLWRGVHLECHAMKSTKPEAPTSREAPNSNSHPS
jgi:SAM-dependent methyltransferase